MRLWDTLFADAGGRTDCLLRVCTAMLLNVREELLQVRAPRPPPAWGLHALRLCIYSVPIPRKAYDSIVT